MQAQTMIMLLSILFSVFACQASPTTNNDVYEESETVVELEKEHNTALTTSDQQFVDSASLAPAAPVEPREETPVVSPTPVSTTPNAVTEPEKVQRPAPSAPVVREEEEAQEEAADMPSHETWDALLRAHVSSTGQVDYAGLKAKLTQLDSYLDELAANHPQNDWPAQAVKAYWINAYNAFTVKLILENYPVNSIRDIDGGNPWDTKWIKLGTKTYSLNQIEHDILRPRFQDARIHFAVNCAATSCPPLYNRAFTAENTNSFLSRLTKSFINNTNYNTITEKDVEVSKIFEWYGEDFGDLRDYLNEYSGTTISADQTISFREYDWGLNGK